MSQVEVKIASTIIAHSDRVAEYFAAREANSLYVATGMSTPERAKRHNHFKLRLQPSLPDDATSINIRHESVTAVPTASAGPKEASTMLLNRLLLSIFSRLKRRSKAGIGYANTTRAAFVKKKENEDIIHLPHGKGPWTKWFPTT